MNGKPSRIIFSQGDKYLHVSNQTPDGPNTIAKNGMYTALPYYRDFTDFITGTRRGQSHGKHDHQRKERCGWYITRIYSSTPIPHNYVKNWREDLQTVFS